LAADTAIPQKGATLEIQLWLEASWPCESQRMPAHGPGVLTCRVVVFSVESFGLAPCRVAVAAGSSSLPPRLVRIGTRRLLPTDVEQHTRQRPCSALLPLIQPLGCLIKALTWAQILAPHGRHHVRLWM